MCTLTYLPTSDGFIITQNRDESPLRAAPEFPCRESIGDEEVVYPRDPEGGGTWVACMGNRVVSILNGAYEPHERYPPYRQSRGRVPLDLLGMGEFSNMKNYDCQGLEPFSLFDYGHGEVIRFSWDGSRLHREDFDPALPHIWQSAPLYDPAMQNVRALWFEEWLQEHQDYTAKQILDWHRNGGEGVGEMNICMFRPGVQTTAITQVIVGKKPEFTYSSILSGEHLTV